MAPLPLLFDREAVRAVDRAATEQYGMPGIVLMENAARGLLREAVTMLEERSTPPWLVLIFCGAGNNGGDGYALARNLHNAGIEVAIAPIGEPKPDSDAGINRMICRRLGLPEISLDELDAFDTQAGPDLIVDAIFGTGLDRPVSGGAARAIEWINGCKRPVLAVDVPSGLDVNTGRPVGRSGSLAVRATRTVTFVGWKVGFTGLDAQRYIGDVAVVDIGAPVELLEELGQRPDSFRPEPPEHQDHLDPVEAAPPARLE